VKDDADLAAAWSAAMRRGDFERAWHISDLVLARRVAEHPVPIPPRHEQGIWDGRPIDGRRVLVRCYHGLGDTLQFARFLPRVARRTSALTVWAQPALLPLLGTLPDSGRVLPLHDGCPGAEYEVDLEIMELAHALRVEPGTLSSEVPYFRAIPAPRLSERFSVGVVAQAGGWDGRRSVPVEFLAALGELPGVALFNLHPDGAVPGAGNAGSADILEAASRVLSLDLVITVDTMMAHLAGALGAPTWTLLHADADWRWMDGRDDTPWYPTMRLFRQRRAGEWKAVVEEVRERLLKAAQPAAR
jgi:hypothetical protein